MPNIKIDYTFTYEMTNKEKIKKINTAIKKSKITDFETPYHYYDTIACYELQIIFIHYDIENTENNKLLKTVNKINWLRNKMKNNKHNKLINEGSRTLKPIEDVEEVVYLHPRKDMDFENEMFKILDYLNYTEYNLLKKKLNHKRTLLSKKQDILKRLNELKNLFNINEDEEEEEDEEEKEEEEELDIVLFVPKHKRK